MILDKLMPGALPIWNNGCCVEEILDSDTNEVAIGFV
jgi:hypothetical protein